MMVGNPLSSLRERSAAVRRHAVSVSDAHAAAPHLRASLTVHLAMFVPDRMPLRLKRLVHYGPVDQDHDAVHRHCCRRI
jgi:hypothetical protein